MKTGKRTDGSVAGVFTDLSEILEEGTTSPMRRVAPSHPERELHRLAPTSLMVDTQPTEFVPTSPGPISDRLVPDESQEVAALLKAPTSQTIRFAGEDNPAAAFAPSPTPAAPMPVSRTEPIGDQATREAMLAAARASMPSVHSIAPIAPVAPMRASMSSFAPIPVKSGYSFGVLLAAIVISAIVATSATALVGAKLVRSCRDSSHRVCALLN